MWFAAVLLGLAGSLHCAGMCSPLMVAVTTQQPFMVSKIVYNTGRIATYGLLGVVAASLGSWFHFMRYQQVLSFGLGSLLLLFGIIGISGVNIPILTPILMSFAGWIKRRFAKTLGQATLYSRFVLGMLNGLLPCGLTYLALSACFVLPVATDGLIYMVLFGLGTWPVMVGIGWISQKALIANWFRSRKLTQVVLVIAGALLIGRVWYTHGTGTSASVEGASIEAVCP